VRPVIIGNFQTALGVDLSYPRWGVERTTNMDDVVAMNLFDFIILNGDRKQGNMFAVEPSPGAEKRLALFDHGHSMGLRLNEGNNSFRDIRTKAHDNETSFSSYMGDGYAGPYQNSFMSELSNRVASGRMSIDDVASAISRVQDLLREAEQRKPMAVMVSELLNSWGVKESSPNYTLMRDRAMFMVRRAKFIMDSDPRDLARAMIMRGTD
jgi:hypothetical protein